MRVLLIPLIHRASRSEQHAQLLSLLDAYDNDATQYVTELLAQYPHSVVLKDVQSALDNYDFERAKVRFSVPWNKPLC